MKTILLPVDFSDVTARVLETARSLASAFQSRLILLNVEEPEPEFIGFEAGPQPVRVAVANSVRSAKKQLEQLEGELKTTGLQVSAFHLQGPVIETILTQAAKHQADLIVVGSHGHGAIYNLLVGSIASGLLKSATCPVLVVPARKASESSSKLAD